MLLRRHDPAAPKALDASQLSGQSWRNAYARQPSRAVAAINFAIPSWAGGSNLMDLSTPARA
jgi:hypothetical protein